MGSLTDFAELASLKHLTKEQSYTPAATVYLGLFLADPTDTGSGDGTNEVGNANAYARVAITFSAAANRAVLMATTATFTQATGTWGTCSHWGILTSGTWGSGDMLAYGQFTTPKSIVSGNTPTVNASDISVGINAGGTSNYAANALLNLLFRNQTFTINANALGLTTATISDSMTGATITEVANANNYSRLAINPVSGGSPGTIPGWGLAAAGQVSNYNKWTMATPSGSWGTVTSGFIADSPSHGAGNILFYGNDLVDQLIGSGDTVYLDPQDLVVSIS